MAFHQLLRSRQRRKPVSRRSQHIHDDKKSAPTARILDPKGEIGKLYGAKVTPHMFIVNKEGVLVYEGAIDDNDSNKQEDIATSKNYVKAALDSLAEGKPIESAQTKAYGCGVKYE